jgi:hypothetical protein
MAMGLVKGITTHLPSNTGRQIGFCADTAPGAAKKGPGTDMHQVTGVP